MFKKFSAFFIICCTMMSCGGSDTTTMNETNVDETSAALEAGRIVYEQRCLMCHGVNGAAGIAGAANLQATKLDSADAAKVVAEGRNAMPPFRGALTPEEIGNVVHYIRSFR